MGFLAQLTFNIEATSFNFASINKGQACISGCPKNLSKQYGDLRRLKWARKVYSMGRLIQY
jgi:hypothetical protein